MHPALIAAALTGQVLQQGILTDLSRTPAPAMEAVDPEEYVLGPGDLLWVASEGGLPFEFSAGSAAGSVFYTAVSIDGHVLLPMVGAVDVSGLSLAEGAALIEQRMRSRIVGCRPSAGLSVARTSMVSVTGGVASPGAVTIKGTDRLSDALRAAGGPVPGAALSRVEILGNEGDTAFVDLYGFLLEGDPRDNPLLAPGERVHVETADSLVTIEGAVWIRGPFNPGPSAETGVAEGASAVLEHLEGESLAMLVVRAGGYTPWARREACYIVRESAGTGAPEIIPAQSETAVLPGDRVVVPGAPLSIAVTGYVPSPGTYPHVAGRDAFYYIAGAGGFGPEARSSGTTVTLPGGEQVDAEGMADIPAGSIITVPRKSLVWWQDWFTILTGVATLVIAWQSI